MSLALLRANSGTDGEVLQAALKALAEGEAFRGNTFLYLKMAPPSGPDGLEFPDAMQQTSDSAFPWPGYDAAIATTDAALEFLLGDSDIQRMIDRADTYRVRRHIALDDNNIRHAQPSNGISYLYGLYFHDDLPPSAIERMWGNHPETVERVHVGVSRYTQWWVQSKSENAPPIGGIAELHFATREDLTERLFDSERGKKEVMTDQKSFIKGGMPRLFAYQYVY